MDAEERGYERSPSLQAYAQAIIEAFPDVFDHLVDADIGYLFTNHRLVFKMPSIGPCLVKIESKFFAE